MVVRMIAALSLMLFCAAQTAIGQPAIAQPAPTPAPATDPSARPPAQPAPSQTPPATTQPADDAAELTARVIEVVGSVEHAAEGVDPLDADAWHPVEVDMELAAATQIRTGLRSRCTLQFGAQPDETVIQLRRATLASIRDFQQTDEEQRVRIGLGYGTVRGGSSEGTLRSDVVVDSTVATLAKRGTEGWQIQVEPVSGVFIISLAESGLIEAYAKATDESKEVLPGEYVTDATIARMWINQEIFNRAIRFYEVPMLTDAELAFVIGETTGYGSIAPEGHELYRMAGRSRAFGGFPQAASPTAVAAGVVALQTLILQPRPIHRPDGNFGFAQTFRVLAPKPILREVARRSLRAPRR